MEAYTRPSIITGPLAGIGPLDSSPVIGDATPWRATDTIAGGLLPTSIKICPLTSLLVDFPKKAYIFNGFTHGFSLQFKNKRVGLTYNSPTVNNNLGIALEKVGTEVKFGANRRLLPKDSLP